MKVKTIKTVLYQLDFKTPFRISYEAVDRADVLFVKIETDNGVIGYGSASPDEQVTGETIKDDYRKSRQINPAFFSEDLTDVVYYNNLFKKKFPASPALRAAWEMAIFDIIGQYYRQPLGEMIGRCRGQAEMMITVGIKDYSATMATVRQKLKTGYRIIKLKCGVNLQGDLKKIKAVRKIIPADCRLIIDANQGYRFDEAKYFLEQIKDLRIAFLEQPIAAKDYQGLAALTASKIVPIVADESIIDFHDARYLLENDIVDGVNIKLMKCGGIIDFLNIFHLAKTLHKITAIGCMYESHLSLTLGGHLALALPIDFVDLDSGHLDFTNDPFVGGMKIKKNYLTANPKIYGLGAHPNSKLFG